MGNYKARMTAKNMQITDDNKEQLVRLMIFATMLGNGIDESEADRTITIASDWHTDISKDVQTVDSFRTLKKEEWFEKQNLSDFIAVLVDILSDSSFFDIQDSLIKTLQQYSMDFAESDPNATPELASKIKFSNSDFACQFYEDNGEGGKREVSETEKYANLMYLSNQLAHVFGESFNENIDGVTNSQIKHITRELRKIKDWCIHKLIEQKKDGKPIDIAISTDPTKSFNNGRISFSLPNYLEPFIVHYNSSILSEEESKVCDGTERYISKGLRTSFPQYLTDKKMELLERLYNLKSSDAREYNYARKYKLEWLFETKRILKSLERKKIKNTPSKESTEIVATSEEAKPLDIQRENTETLEKIQAYLGISFPNYFKEGFLKRTSYSISRYMQTVSSSIKDTLVQKGIPEDQIDKEFAKLIVYMKMVKPLSIINLKSKEEKINQALEALKEYQPAYDIISSGLQKESSYTALRSQVRKQVNSLNINMETANPTASQEETIEEGEQSHAVTESSTVDVVANDTTEEISLPIETVLKFNAEIISINEEITELTTAIQQSSNRLSLLQSKLLELQSQIQKALNGSTGTKEEKGDR